LVTGGVRATSDPSPQKKYEIAQNEKIAGVNGAIVSASGLEIGSPGTVSAVPLPDSVVLLLSGLGALGLFTIGRNRQPVVLA
jgi:hypothetical protein